MAHINVRPLFYKLSIGITLGIIIISFFWKPVLWAFVLFGPLILMGIADVFSKKHTIRKNFPVIGRMRYMLELIRPEIMQYFVENDREGRPLDRVTRSMVYQRAKNVMDTIPFGTQMDVYEPGYEWMAYSMYAGKVKVDEDPRIMIGGDNCTQPYSASLLNISAMSFGALSNRAVLALNKGARMGYFAHNTGEGGISPYHLEPGGDLIWQIGTAYFGCRDENGNFDRELYKEKATIDNVKMIELKIAQGAKPGHGGILPAVKNTEEIARIRHVKPHTEIDSPPSHTAFDSPEGLCHFIQDLREMSGGKPVGFKMVIGRKQEFIDICEAMVKTGLKPDFISIDGGEGGTGAAPLEFSNSLGMPLLDGLAFAIDTLRGYDLKKDIKVIASGKIMSSFQIARALAIGADLCYSARGMMLALGCIQALLCNKNTCPTGITTQNPHLVRGLNVEDKAHRVYNFHKNTMKSFGELITAAGLVHHSEIDRTYINLRTDVHKVVRYDELYPVVPVGAYLDRIEKEEKAPTQ